MRRASYRCAVLAAVLLPFLAQPQYGVAAAADSLADTVARRVLAAVGGASAWEALAYLQFNFSVQHGQAKAQVVRHFWSRHTGDYRIELPGPAAEPYVVLLNVKTRTGTAAWHGDALDEKEAKVWVETALRRFDSDGFWLVMPFLLFEPGVTREYAADSSDAGQDVLKLTFTDGGLATGAEYWLYIDAKSGLPARLTYRTPGTPTLRAFDFEAWEEHETAAGPLTFSTRKRSRGRPFLVLTDNVSVPAEVANDMFTDMLPRLSPSDNGE